MVPSRVWVPAVATLVACLALGATTATAAPGDIGFEGPSYAPASGTPTGSKPESKLWFNDGQWWGSLYAPAAGGFRIHRLDRSTDRWIDTGTALDDRPDSHADTLWDAASGKLYVASHRFTESGGPASAANAGRLYRFSYAGGSYSLDPGFPVTVNAARTETLVIDKDSTGTLWATWTQDSRVYVNRTVGGDAVWGTPYVIPGAGALDSDDISSLIHFAGRIGVMWSNQNEGREYFAVHPDGAGDGAWTTEVVPTGASPDDHINLKADAAGRVFAAVKTGESGGSQPRTLLLARSPTGSWSTTIFGTVSNSHTRAIVQLDEQHGILHMIATCPRSEGGSGQSGGDICEKTSPVDGIAFAPGIGTAIIRDASSADLNDASSTKQNVDGGTGLVVLANNESTNVYWHADLSLGAGPPVRVDAAFGVDTAAGPTSLDVLFSDSSTGAPTSWSWSFGDGTTSSERNPTHRYPGPGTYTVTLRVATSTQSDTETRTVTVVVPSASTPAGGVLGSASAAAARVTLRAERLRRQRVLLWGTVKPTSQDVTRVTLQRRNRRGRWLFVRRLRTHPRSAGMSSYALTVRRLSVRSVYRVVATTADGGRSPSATLRLARRAGR